jgi:hypothetical protein
MDDSFAKRVRAAAVAGWWTLLIACAILLAAWLNYLWMLSAQPAWMLSLCGPDVTWLQLETISLWIMAVFKLCIWLAAFGVLGLHSGPGGCESKRVDLELIDAPKRRKSVKIGDIAMGCFGRGNTPCRFASPCSDAARARRRHRSADRRPSARVHARRLFTMPTRMSLRAGKHNGCRTSATAPGRARRYRHRHGAGDGSGVASR